MDVQAALSLMASKNAKIYETLVMLKFMFKQNCIQIMVFIKQKMSKILTWKPSVSSKTDAVGSCLTQCSRTGLTKYSYP